MDPRRRRGGPPGKRKQQKPKQQQQQPQPSTVAVQARARGFEADFSKIQTLLRQLARSKEELAASDAARKKEDGGPFPKAAIPSALSELLNKTSSDLTKLITQYPVEAHTNGIAMRLWNECYLWVHAWHADGVKSDSLAIEQLSKNSSRSSKSPTGSSAKEGKLASLKAALKQRQAQRKQFFGTSIQALTRVHNKLRGKLDEHRSRSVSRVKQTARGNGNQVDEADGSRGSAGADPVELALRQLLQHFLLCHGDLLRYTSRLQEARTFYIDAIRVLPSQGRAHNSLAVTHFHEGNKVLSVYRFVRALLAPQPWPRVAKGITALLLEGVGSLSSLVELHPDPPLPAAAAAVVGSTRKIGQVQADMLIRFLHLHGSICLPELPAGLAASGESDGRGSCGSPKRTQSPYEAEMKQHMDHMCLELGQLLTSKPPGLQVQLAMAALTMFSVWLAHQPAPSPLHGEDGANGKSSSSKRDVSSLERQLRLRWARRLFLRVATVMAENVRIPDLGFDPASTSPFTYSAIAPLTVLLSWVRACYPWLIQCSSSQKQAQPDDVAMVVESGDGHDGIDAARVAVSHEVDADDDVKAFWSAICGVYNVVVHLAREEEEHSQAVMHQMVKLSNMVVGDPTLPSAKERTVQSRSGLSGNSNSNNSSGSGSDEDEDLGEEDDEEENEDNDCGSDDEGQRVVPLAEEMELVTWSLLNGNKRLAKQYPQKWARQERSLKEGATTFGMRCVKLRRFVLWASCHNNGRPRRRRRRHRVSVNGDTVDTTRVPTIVLNATATLAEPAHTGKRPREDDETEWPAKFSATSTAAGGGKTRGRASRRGGANKAGSKSAQGGGGGGKKSAVITCGVLPTGVTRSGPGGAAEKNKMKKQKQKKKGKASTSNNTNINTKHDHDAGLGEIKFVTQFGKRPGSPSSAAVNDESDGSDQVDNESEEPGSPASNVEEARAMAGGDDNGDDVDDDEHELDESLVRGMVSMLDDADGDDGDDKDGGDRVQDNNRIGIGAGVGAGGFVGNNGASASASKSRSHSGARRDREMADDDDSDDDDDDDDEEEIVFGLLPPPQLLPSQPPRDTHESHGPHGPSHLHPEDQGLEHLDASAPALLSAFCDAWDGMLSTRERDCAASISSSIRNGTNAINANIAFGDGVPSQLPPASQSSEDHRAQSRAFHGGALQLGNGTGLGSFGLWTPAIASAGNASASIPMTTPIPSSQHTDRQLQHNQHHPVLGAPFSAAAASLASQRPTSYRVAPPSESSPLPMSRTLFDAQVERQRLWPNDSQSSSEMSWGVGGALVDDRAGPGVGSGVGSVPATAAGVAQPQQQHGRSRAPPPGFER